MGLLQKAKEQTSNSAQTREIKFNSVINNLKQYVNRIEFYPNLFRELIGLFGIEKGALLIKEDNKFILNSIIGYDETTKNRLRLDEEELEKYLTSKNPKSLEKYFSIRETITLDRIDILTFKNSDKTMGILLISQYRTMSIPSTQELQYYCSKLENLWKENPLNRLQKGNELTLEIKDSIISYAHSVKNSENRIIFIKFNIEGIITALTSSDSLTTSSSIRSNINKMLKSFINKRGEVFQLNSNEILLAILDKNQFVNASVIQSQIMSAFKTVFSNSLSNIDLNFETLIWKDKALDNIIEHLTE